MLLLPRFTFPVIALLFDLSPLNQIDQDVHRKYTLSSDAELISIRSLTLGKVTGRNSCSASVQVRSGTSVNHQDVFLYPPRCRYGEPGRGGSESGFKRFLWLPVLRAVQPRGPAKGGSDQSGKLTGHHSGWPGGVKLWRSGRVNLTHSTRWSTSCFKLLQIWNQSAARSVHFITTREIFLFNIKHPNLQKAMKLQLLSNFWG